MKRLFAALILVFLGTQPGVAQELGRLFFTADERAALDARRKARVPDKPAAVVVASPTTKLDGYVKRSAGPSTVWVNGEAVDGARPGDGRASVPLGEGQARVTLKPGEVLDRGTGEVRDVVEGEIRIRRSP